MNILIVNNHPDKESFNVAIASAFENEAKLAGHTVNTLNITDLDFDPNLRFGYRKRTTLEPDLIKAQDMIRKASHIIWIYPVWWGGLPALAKGFMDRAFLPGFAWELTESDEPVGLLKGKTAQVITTMDADIEEYQNLQNQNINTNLEFIGLEVVKNTNFAPTSSASTEQINLWLNEVKTLAQEIGKAVKV
ncbi:NAD(P)H dehydrogenase (quinone) [Fulvitalea axinellae]|uniref:NAD(P)H dehydrogenase (Quinone) n=1 Tax=Fulvitalea axinellae TaxID=1182444 RepID=A0AAU9DEW5_9BACT|nr:NAD(P)H dehydrogenase (quinone) [Fulvitalea axinellae]